MKFLVIAATAAALVLGATASEESFFPFVISYDARENAVNVSRFLSAPAGRDGFLRVEGDAFVNDAGPVRFHATNLTGPANFPAPADADALAARFARFGINCVRMHFMDTWYESFMPERTQGILADDSVTQRKLDPAQLDKMDYLVAALKRRGIYVNLNLHVGRTLDTRDGLPDGGPWANKCVGQFMPRMIELQKEYARDLLTHVNAYTGNAYVDEPAVALIEISNEDSFAHPWLNGSFFGYPEPFRQELASQWNDWLRRTYGSEAAVTAAWTGPGEPLGENLVRSDWRTEKGSADVTFVLTNGMCRAMTRRCEDSHPKVFRTFPLRKNRTYTLEFRIRRLSGKGPVGFTVASSGNGGACLGFKGSVEPVRDWLTVTRTFVALADCADAFVEFTRLPAGVTDIRDVTLKPGAPPLDANLVEGFAFGDIPLVTRSDPVAMQRDFLRFLHDTELAYWTGLRSYIKDELKAHAPVSGTQLGFSPPTVQDRLDYVDNHAYWRHPLGEGYSSPKKKEPWTIGADSMVNSLEKILWLAGIRIVGKPYTIGEYNHPYPNPFGAEGQPMLAAFAAFQGWSGVFQYSYNHYVDQWSPDANPWSLFDSIARTDVLAHFPACAAMVLRGDVARSRGVRAPSATVEDTFRVQMGGSVVVDYSRTGGGPVTDAILHAVGVSLGAPVDRGVVPGTADGKTLVSDTGELVWNREKLGKAYFAIRAPQVKLFTGFPEGRTVDLGGVKLSVGRTSLDWATVTLLSRDATGFGEKGPASILLAATAGCGNAGRVVKRLPGDKLTLTDRGHGPVMAEGVPLTVVLPAKVGTVGCWALDERGERKVEVPVAADANGFAKVSVGPSCRTVWYELVVR